MASTVEPASLIFATNSVPTKSRPPARSRALSPWAITHTRTFLPCRGWRTTVPARSGRRGAGPPDGRDVHRLVELRGLQALHRRGLARLERSSRVEPSTPSGTLAVGHQSTTSRPSTGGHGHHGHRAVEVHRVQVRHLSSRSCALRRVTFPTFVRLEVGSPSRSPLPFQQDAAGGVLVMNVKETVHVDRHHDRDHQPGCAAVFALNCLQKSMMLSPCGPTPSRRAARAWAQH